MKRETNFQQPLTVPWKVTQLGMGRVTPDGSVLRLALPASDDGTYHDAQLTDYARRDHFSWKPPMRVDITAYFQSPPLVGTAGFGLWNHPYGFNHDRFGMRLPKAIWFFFSAPPSNMQLAHGVNGPGWKAATIDAGRWPFLALLPFAPLGFLFMRSSTLYHRLWPLGQRAIHVTEHLLNPNWLAERHTYTIDWLANDIRFAVDEKTVHEAHMTINGTLGFIAWIDNQYAVVTPQGHFGFGVSAIPQAQTLMLEKVSIQSLG